MVTCFSKAEGDDIVLAVVNLDPHGTRECTVALWLPALGVDWGETVTVRDDITGAEFTWGQFNFVRLDPWQEPAHVFTVSRNVGSRV